MIKNEIIAILIFFTFLVVISLLVLLFMNRQSKSFRVAKIDMSKDKPPKVRFVQLSDIHIRRLCVDKDALFQAVVNEAPEFLVFTGDYCEKESEIPLFCDFLRELLSILPPIPCYLTFGNHENKGIFDVNPLSRETFSYALQKISPNVHVLENEMAVFTTPKSKIVIGGLGDSRSNKENVANLVRKWSDAGDYLILLCHNADILLKLEHGSADLLLTGHTHGGQIWLPFRMEFYLFHKDKTPKRGLIYGKHHINNIPLYITSGVGCTTLPLRLFSKSEIAVIEM